MPQGWSSQHLVDLHNPETTHSLFLTCHSVYFPSHSPFVFIFSPTRPPHCSLAAITSEPLQLPLCLKQEMSPEVTSTSPSPNMAASNLAFVELQALQKPVSVSSSSCSSNHFPNAFNSFSHHAPVYGQFSSQSVISGNAGIHLTHVHNHNKGILHLCQEDWCLFSLLITLLWTFQLVTWSMNNTVKCSSDISVLLIWITHFSKAKI